MTKYLLPLTLIALVACNGEDNTDEPIPTVPMESLLLIGSYVDDFDGTHDITETTWTMNGGDTQALVFNVLSYDNEAMVVIAQNDSNNAFSPSLYSHFDWTGTQATALYFCQIVFDAATEADAESATPADAADLTNGCNGFAWSQLLPTQ